MFVVDDDPSVLRSLSRMFQLEGYAVESFDHPRQMLERKPGQRPGCVVLDLRMPELNGLELQEELRRAGWKQPIVFISGHGDVPAAVKAMKAGAVDFLPKPVGTTELLEVVERALARERAALASEQELEALRVRFSALTPREREVCQWVARGLLNKPHLRAANHWDTSASHQRAGCGEPVPARRAAGVGAHPADGGARGAGGGGHGRGLEPGGA